jgi:hypothetical protein
LTLLSYACRMYATAAARSDGLLLLCGGRDVHGTPLADAYGFARHRDGRWEWHAAPGSMPSGRYQHGAVFVGTRLHISGGAVGGGRMVRGGEVHAVVFACSRRQQQPCCACVLYCLHLGVGQCCRKGSASVCTAMPCCR